MIPILFFLFSDYRAEIVSDTIESQCGRVLQIAADQTKREKQKNKIANLSTSFRQFEIQ